MIHILITVLFLSVSVNGQSVLELIKQYNDSENKSIVLEQLKTDYQKCLFLRIMEDSGSKDIILVNLISDAKKEFGNMYSKDLLYLAIAASDLHFIKLKIDKKEYFSPFSQKSQFDINHPLLLASYFGNLEIIKTIVGDRDISNFVFSNETPLFFSRNIETTEFFLRKGIPINFDSRGAKALSALIYSGFDESASLLIKKGAELPDDILTASIENSCVKVVGLLVEKGYKLDNNLLSYVFESSRKKNNLFKIFEKELGKQLILPSEYLFYITKEEHFELFKYISEKYKLDLNIILDGESLIGRASQDLNIKLVKYLISKKVILKNGIGDLYTPIILGELQKISKMKNQKRLALLELLLQANAPTKVGRYNALANAEHEDDKDFLNLYYKYLKKE